MSCCCLISIVFISFICILINIFRFLIIRFMFVFLFCMFCFLFCVFCVFVLFCVLFLPMYMVVYFLFVYNFTDHCHQVETQLQLRNIVYCGVTSYAPLGLNNYFNSLANIWKIRCGLFEIKSRVPLFTTLTLSGNIDGGLYGLSFWFPYHMGCFHREMIAHDWIRDRCLVI